MTSRDRVLILCACAGAGLAARMIAPPDEAGGSWVVVAKDSTYTISIDTARIRYRPGGVYVVWSRTDHAVHRFYHGKRFNREIVQSLLQCERLSFKVARVDMALDGRAVARQRTDDGELGRQVWRRVEAGTTDAIAAQATCDLARRAPTAQRGR
jgi:hypothetical protein